MNEKSIAPCGINCSVCLAYLRKRNPCAGCNSSTGKIHHCDVCGIKNCENLKKTKGKVKFCFKCTIFPCIRIRKLDERYKTKYRTSVIKNLDEIKQKGIRKFIEKERKRWKCQCRGVICMHTGLCSDCG